MSLVSNAFWLLVMAAVLLYYLMPDRVKWITLLVFSMIYYACGGVKYLFFILYSITVIYLFARLVEKARANGAGNKLCKTLTGLGLFLNFGMLGAVKYADFVFENLNRFLPVQLPMLQILFPLGISFYTFQSSGYLLDVYWERTGAEKNYFRFALFVSFFPQLMQGPIGNFSRLSPQLYAPHNLTSGNIRDGILRICIGLAKKMILADWAGVFADAIWGDPSQYAGVCMAGLILYGIQLYCDFSGAMDVVIGISRLFGITLDENFRHPYLAVSIANFWKRWHITLGEWMKNYVLYPLTLSGWMKAFSKHIRRRLGRKWARVLPIALADIIIFLLVGIWHGASWKFIMYGLANGLILAFSELMRDNYAAMRKALHITGKETWYHVFTILRTFFLVSLCWSFDRSEDLAQAGLVLKNALTKFDPSLLLSVSAGRGGTAFAPAALSIIGIGCVVMVLIGILEERGMNLKGRILARPLALQAAIWLLLLLLVGIFGCTGAPRGFIYAQF